MLVFRGVTTWNFGPIWPNGIIFHLHLDFPEIAGDFPYQTTILGSKMVVFSVATLMKQIIGNYCLT